ncbi:MAG: polysaccharide deacetylase family protein [Candidatus Omnitrophica bacterium]|nr:polysaccharide deacetylase family protein [Candidatus Omnitrophota bacterium]
MLSLHSITAQIKKKGKNIYYSFASFSPLSPCAIIFLFHTVESQSSPWTAGHRYITPYRIFQKQIRFIKDNFSVVPTSVLVGALSKSELKCPLASIHFDDGFRSYQDIALPYLKRESVPSTVFLVDAVLKGYIPLRNRLAFCLNTGNKKRLFRAIEEYTHTKSAQKSKIGKMNVYDFLAWIKNRMDPQIENIINREFLLCQNDLSVRSPFIGSKDAIELSRDPDVEIGSHTLTHPMLTDLNAEEQKKEIITGHENLENILGKKIHFFAYPHGGKTHFNETSRAIILEQGHMVAFSSYGGVNPDYQRDDIRRITLTDHSTLDIKSTVLSNYRKSSSSINV